MSGPATHRGVSDQPWTYLLIPHDAIDESKTLAGLAATYEYRREG